jgi:uncharacterized membrane protein YfhO
MILSRFRNLSREGSPCSWAAGLLISLQVLACGIIFASFIFGPKHFAYTDIGSDSYAFAAPQMIHWVNYLLENGRSGWSFNIGLGGPIYAFLDPFSLISLPFGAEHVLELRVWLMIAKLMVGGIAFFAFLHSISITPSAAIFGGLIYSFCGYAQVDAQWDPSAHELVFYPLLMLAFSLRLRGGSALPIVGVVALAMISNVFVVSFCIFSAICCLASVALADNWRQHAFMWLRTIVLPFLLGMGLAAPALIPYVIQILDSPRVSGRQALFSERLAELWSINDWPMVLVQIAGLFHKNILGVGNFYQGWMNYFEGPGFYIGTAALLLIPQLWQGGKRQRLALILGMTTLVLYILFPAIRYGAYGFAVPYFRVSSLWITLMLLLLAVMALDLVLRQGLQRSLLIGACLFCLLTPVFLRHFLPISHSQFIAWIVFASMATLFLNFAGSKWLSLQRLVWPLLLLVFVELTWSGYQSINSQRQAVAARSPGYFDLSWQAVAEIKKRDPGFYRVEKGFVSVSNNDALVQNYFGVQSYAFHGNSIVRFHIGLGLIPPSNPSVNYTNWLPDFGARYLLYSLVGVKYFLSNTLLNWTGFSEVGRIGNIIAYQNSLALPIAVMHNQQVDETEFRKLPLPLKDRLMFDAVIAEHPWATIPQIDIGAWRSSNVHTREEWYIDRALQLQRTGLQLQSFSQNQVIGEISPEKKGVLVFSIPYSTGWSARVNGVPTPTFRANLGFTALELDAGKHRVELSYRIPGLMVGWALAVIALGTLLVWGHFAEAYRQAPKQALD